MIGIVIAVEQPMVRAGVRASLELDEGFTVIGEAKSARSLTKMLEDAGAEPSVLLVDQDLRGLDILAFLDRLAEQEGAPGVVLLSDNADPDNVQAAFSRGALGYILKRIEPRDLPAAIRQAVDGSAYHAHGLPALAEDVAARSAGLTNRELAVVRAVARGLSNSAVGKELWVTEQTVKFHLSNVYRKLGVDNRTEAARWAVSRGLV
jgi:DNA-binding NarL/FixJ family response regulator